MEALLLRAGDVEPVQETIDYPTRDPLTAPLISCLMVTRGELHPGHFAIECFSRQSYVNRELVIVCDRPGSALQAFVARLADERIRFVEADEAPLGTLRNIAVAQARGDLVAQWDDDDLYHPDRLRVQIAALADGVARATVLTRWMMWWPARRLLAISGIRLWEGSLLAWRDAVGSYPALPRGEDTAMVDAMRSRVDMRALDAPRAYLYVMHASATFGDEHRAALFNSATETFAIDAYDAAFSRLTNAFPVRDYLAGLPAK